jgi:VIT1/CCC1 family predicted Fe2+/Mn2+ transporter
METYTSRERKNLLKFTKEIYLYKIMLSKGYERILRRAEETRTARLLEEIREHEVRDAEMWLGFCREVEADEGWSLRGLDLKVAVMMTVLGPRGFLEWTLIAEDESVEELYIYASILEDKRLSERWLRRASDEFQHVDNMKQKVLGMESWEMSGGGGVRDVIFGFNDGLVSILALVAGVYGAITDNSIVLLTGVAGAIGGTISMGAGAYISAKSEQEVLKRERRRKGLSGNRDPETEAQELTTFFQSKGFNRSEATTIAQRVQAEMSRQSQQSLQEIVGVTSADEWPASKAGLLTGLSFLIASIVPLFPFTFLEETTAAIVAGIGSILALFTIGASKAIFTRMNWARSGLEMMVIGTLAAMTTFLIGTALGV